VTLLESKSGSGATDWARKQESAKKSKCSPVERNVGVGYQTKGSWGVSHVLKAGAGGDTDLQTYREKHDHGGEKGTDKGNDQSKEFALGGILFLKDSGGRGIKKIFR